MKFKYEVVSDNNEVSLIGIEGECPEILKIPTFIDVDNKKMKVVRIMFHSSYYRLKYRGENGIICKVLYIPETVEIFSLSHNKYIQEVYLPNSLTKIYNGAFAHCEELKTVHLPQNLKQIYHGAFSGCKKIENISIPSTVVKMGNACFCDCNSLTSITIPENVTEVGENFFANCYSLDKVIFKNDSTYFYPSAFRGCKKLKELSNHIIENGLLYNLKKTELYSFLGTEKHDGIIIVPASVRELGYGFSSSIDLVSIDLSQTKISNIRSITFSDCINLETVILPPTVKSIDDRAFSGCIKLSKINLPNSIENIGVACFYNCALKEITLPNSLAEIPQEAFKNCKELSKVDIPSSIKTIYNSAFENCNSIKQVIISRGYQNNISKIFQHSDTIEFIYRVQELNIRGYKKTGAYTHGRFRPCPYCGSDDVTTFCDGTAECNACGGEYTYQY